MSKHYRPRAPTSARAAESQAEKITKILSKHIPKMRNIRTCNQAQDQLRHLPKLRRNNHRPLERIKDHRIQSQFAPVGVTATRITAAESVLAEAQTESQTTEQSSSADGLGVNLSRGAE